MIKKRFNSEQGSTNIWVVSILALAIGGVLFIYWDKGNRHIRKICLDQEARNQGIQTIGIYREDSTEIENRELLPGDSVKVVQPLSESEILGFGPGIKIEATFGESKVIGLVQERFLTEAKICSES